MRRWHLSIPDEADRQIRMFLARTGMNDGDLSAFVVEACRGVVLRRTVVEIRSQNEDLTAEQAMRLATGAVAATRARRS
jgi:hypothetical protein